VVKKLRQWRRNMNIGLRTGILERKHWERMGPAMRLFQHLVAWQTKPNGLIWGGSVLTYEELGHELHENARTVERWLAVLRKHRYVVVKHTVHKRMIIYIANSKKYGSAQFAFEYENPVEKPGNAGSKSRSRCGITSTGMRDTSIERKGEIHTISRLKQGHDENRPLPPPGEAELADREAATMEARKALPVWLRRPFQEMADAKAMPATESR
jgi:hypothetical protein